MPSGPSNVKVIERIQHGYDRAGNRLWRKALADPNRLHDEFYSYDGLYRLKDMQRGTLNDAGTAITVPTFAQCWRLDATGNWGNFRQDDDGDGTWDLLQGRSANKVNEITAVTNAVGLAWAQPTYDASGNMTTIPQPADPTRTYTAKYDAWNRLVSLHDGVDQVAGYAYDGLNRRTEKQAYSGGVLDSTRHYFHSSGWQVLEERVDASSSADRQFVWGLRYIDDILLRDRGGERLCGLQDPNWNVTALSDASGAVQERYAYSAYGVPTVLTPAFELRLATLLDWEVLFAGYRWDGERGLYQVRERYYVGPLGCWMARDPIGAGDNRYELYGYVEGSPIQFVDPFGLKKILVQMAAFINMRLGQWLPEPIPGSSWQFKTDIRDFGGPFERSRVRSWFEIDSCDIGNAAGIEAEHAAGQSTRRKLLPLKWAKRGPTPLGKHTYQKKTADVSDSTTTANGTNGKCSTRVTVQASGAYPFYLVSPDIDYKFLIYFIVVSPGEILTKIGYNHNSFPDYEVRIDGTVAYKHATSGTGPGLWNLAFGPNVKGVIDGPTIYASTCCS